MDFFLTVKKHPHGMFYLITRAQLRKREEVMNVDFLTGIASLIASLVGTFGGIITSTKLTNYQINELKKRVDKHNNVIERTYKLQEEGK